MNTSVQSPCQPESSLITSSLSHDDETVFTPLKAHWWHYWPFVFLHAGCLGALYTGASPVAIGIAIALYWVRMFAITGFYHRYFSHRTYKTSRALQLVFALMGLTAVQKGPLWWAAHHRNHHLYSDQTQDVHSPIKSDWLWSHIGWMTNKENLKTDYTKVRDLAKFPELVFLNRHDWLVPLGLFLGLFGLGELLNRFWPGLQTSGLQLLVWGFFISTSVLFHATCSINSVAHLLGTRRYRTQDQSRNNFFLALITMGEGWHNNHHHYQRATRQGFFWWEIDVTYYLLKLMAWVGLVWDLSPVPDKVRLAVPTATSKG